MAALVAFCGHFPTDTGGLLTKAVSVIAAVHAKEVRDACKIRCGEDAGSGRKVGDRLSLAGEIPHSIIRGSRYRITFGLLRELPGCSGKVFAYRQRYRQQIPTPSNWVLSYH